VLLPPGGVQVTVIDDRRAGGRASVCRETGDETSKVRHILTGGGESRINSMAALYKLSSGWSVYCLDA